MDERPTVDAGAIALNAYARMYGEMTMRAIVAEANLAACEDKLKRAMAEAEAKVELAKPVRTRASGRTKRTTGRSQK